MSVVSDLDSGGVDAPLILKSSNYPNLQSVTQGSYVFQAIQKFFSLYKNDTGFAKI